MFIDFLLNVFKANQAQEAIIWQDESYSYGWLLSRVAYWTDRIHAEDLKPGSVTVLEADFSPNSVALFLALVAQSHILVPLTKSVEVKKAEFIDIAQGECAFVIDENDQVQFKKLPYAAKHHLYDQLRENKRPGLVLFSSGSTGKSKAAVHDLSKILKKFEVPRHSLRTITFLLYDHIGGVNTMLYTLSNAGCIITVQQRSPSAVLKAIDRYQVELLPTSPTFINLILLSEAYNQYDLDSLKTVTYGTEPMPESTLKRFHELFPKIRLLQTYGLSELGILRSKSRSSDSLWVKIGGEGFQTRVVNGVLHIKAQSAMLGYLNSTAPLTEDGWFDTGDAVEVDGEYFKILGRTSEIINVGGEKVYPAEVEGVIQELPNVHEVTVYGQKNPITGNMVCAKVTLNRAEDHKEFSKHLKHYCRQKLQNYKVPVKVLITDEVQHTARFKKARLAEKS